MLLDSAIYLDYNATTPLAPEVIEAVVRNLAAAGTDIEWERQDAGAAAFARTGEALPPALLDSVRRNKVALKGPIGTPIAGGFTSVNVGLRKALDLYANLRPVVNLPGVRSRFGGVDLVIVRENTEDLYAGLEHEIPHPHVFAGAKASTPEEVTRLWHEIKKQEKELKKQRKGLKQRSPKVKKKTE
jgi:isocitrate dehydrogenase (NAD+)